MKVYLAGTINTEPWTREWREQLSTWLRFRGHVPLNPMRYQNPETFKRDGLSDTSTPSSFFWKTDMGDLARADVVVVQYRQTQTNGANWRIKFLGESVYRRQSVGTWIELGIASWLHKPIIVITDDPDVRDHPAIQQCAAIVVDNLTEATQWLNKILVPEG